MLSGLPKLFDRNFAIGYLLPVAIFTLVSSALMARFGGPSFLIPLLGTKYEVTDGNAASDVIIAVSNLLDVASNLIGLWLGAVLLLALNRPMYRLLEGYPFIKLRDVALEMYKGAHNPAKFIGIREKRRFQKINMKQKHLIKKYWEPGASKKEIQSQLSSINRKVAQEFPVPDEGSRENEEQWFLPTRFGNIIRAFEVYSQRKHGFEAIGGWERLLNVIPKDYRASIDEAKALTDFWLNLGVVSLVSIVEYVGLALDTGKYNEILWFPLAALIVAWLATLGARTAAVQWGETVKAAIDIFLPELAKRLGFPDNLTHDESRELWRLFNLTMLYPDKKFSCDLTKEIARLLAKKIEQQQLSNVQGNSKDVRQGESPPELGKPGETSPQRRYTFLYSWWQQKRDSKRLDAMKNRLGIG